MSWSRAASKRWRDKFKAKHGIDYSTWYGRKDRVKLSAKCRFCKRFFMPKRWDRGNYCYAPECIKKHDRERVAAYKAKIVKPPKPKRRFQCPECLFHSYTHRPKAVTCSKACSNARYRRLHPDVGKVKNPKPKRLFQCVLCGKDKLTHQPNAVTCSRECNIARQKKKARTQQQSHDAETLSHHAAHLGHHHGSGNQTDAHGDSDRRML